jgi:hypothetical protein
MKIVEGNRRSIFLRKEDAPRAKESIEPECGIASGGDGHMVGGESRYFIDDNLWLIDGEFAV